MIPPPMETCPLISNLRKVESETIKSVLHLDDLDECSGIDVPEFNNVLVQVKYEERNKDQSDCKTI